MSLGISVLWSSSSCSGMHPELRTDALVGYKEQTPGSYGDTEAGLASVDWLPGLEQTWGKRMIWGWLEAYVTKECKFRPHVVYQMLIKAVILFVIKPRRLGNVSNNCLIHVSIRPWRSSVLNTLHRDWVLTNACWQAKLTEVEVPEKFTVGIDNCQVGQPHLVMVVTVSFLVTGLPQSPHFSAS